MIHKNHIYLYKKCDEKIILTLEILVKKKDWLMIVNLIFSFSFIAFRLA